MRPNEKLSLTEKNRSAIQKLTATALLTALVVVLQLFASGIKLGNVSMTFSLVPIVLGAILYGPLVGGVLGGVFGLVVTIVVVTGADVGGYMMFEKLPALTIFLCMLKGIAAGVAAGWVYRAFRKIGKPIVGVLLAAVACPVTNTAIFCIFLLSFYRDVATAWMGGTTYSNLFVYALLGIAGLNFLVELAINVILAPAIERVIYAIRRR